MRGRDREGARGASSSTGMRGPPMAVRQAAALRPVARFPTIPLIQPQAREAIETAARGDEARRRHGSRGVCGPSAGGQPRRKPLARRWWRDRSRADRLRQTGLPRRGLRRYSRGRRSTGPAPRIRYLPSPRTAPGPAALLLAISTITAAHPRPGCCLAKNPLARIVRVANDPFRSPDPAPCHKSGMLASYSAAQASSAAIARPLPRSGRRRAGKSVSSGVTNRNMPTDRWCATSSNGPSGRL